MLLLFYGAKLQILNDIHNGRAVRRRCTGCCFMVQSYKFWMIYTTITRLFAAVASLFYGAKLQILNDIHNNITYYDSNGGAVLWCKVTNFEWYTQLSVERCVVYACCFMVQSYKFWMIYTTCSILPLSRSGCFMVQSYKFWMIYTTNQT